MSGLTLTARRVLLAGIVLVLGIVPWLQFVGESSEPGPSRLTLDSPRECVCRLGEDGCWTASWSVRNEGGHRLILSRADSGCSCAGDEVPGSLIVAPGGRELLSFQSGLKDFGKLCFTYSTNDPRCPEIILCVHAAEARD